MATQTKSFSQSGLPGAILHVGMGAMFVIFLLTGVYTGYLFYHTVKDNVKRIAANANITTRTTTQGDVEQTASFTLPLLGQSTLPINLPIPIHQGRAPDATGITGVKLPDYEKKERVNILLLGVDKRPDEELSRTDTMIVVTVDPNTGTAGMLSIPRDMYVPVHGYEGEDRLNKAYYLGQKDNYPGGGPALTMKTIQKNFGMPIHFYAQVDFNGFRRVIDTLGGIEVDVEQTIDDPKYPGENYDYDPFYIESGIQTLDGETALKYARTRVTPGSDFSRAARQQQVLMAIRDKAVQLDMVPRIPELWDTLSDSIDTNLQLIDIIELSKVAQELERDDLQTVVLGYDYTVDYVTDYGAQVLLPLREKIQVVVEEMFAETEPIGPTQAEIDALKQAEYQARAEAIEQEAQRQEEIRAQLSNENSRLIVQNGTTKDALAEQTAQYLSEQGFTVNQFGEAEIRTYPNTVVIVYDESKLYTLQLLAGIFSLQETNVRRSPSGSIDYDIRIIVGDDFDLEDQPSTLSVTE